MSETTKKTPARGRPVSEDPSEHVSSSLPRSVASWLAARKGTGAKRPFTSRGAMISRAIREIVTKEFEAEKALKNRGK